MSTSTYSYSMNTRTAKISVKYQIVRPHAMRPPRARASIGGLDEINPDDVVHGEYAAGYKDFGNWIDIVYLDDDILRTFSGAVDAQHPVIGELKLLLRDEKKFYAVPIKEVPAGIAFKRADIVAIETTSTIQGNARHGPSCVWSMHFEDGSVRTLEAEYQSYFAYGNTIRPASMTNVSLLEKVFSDDTNEYL